MTTTWKYDPTTADSGGSTNNFEPLAPGKAEATLYEVTPKTSKNSGAPMLELVWDIRRGDDKRRCWDFFVQPHNGSKGNLFRMREMADCMGKLERFKSGEFYPGDYIGCRFEVEIDIDGDFNKIKKYVKCLSDTAERPSPAAEPIPEEDIPF